MHKSTCCIIFADHIMYGAIDQYKINKEVKKEKYIHTLPGFEPSLRGSSDGLELRLAIFTDRNLRLKLYYLNHVSL